MYICQYCFLNLSHLQLPPTVSVMRYYFIPVKMAIIKKSTNSKFWRGCGEKGTLLYCWWEWTLIQPLWKTIWRFLKKLEINVRPTNPTNIPWENHSLCTPVSMAAIFTTRTWNQSRSSLTGYWIKKLWYIYTMEYYSAIKKDQFESVVVKWMNLESLIQNEVRKIKTSIIY